MYLFKTLLISAFNMFPLGRIGLQMLIYGTIYAPFFFSLSVPLFTGWKNTIGHHPHFFREYSPPYVCHNCNVTFVHVLMFMSYPRVCVCLCICVCIFCMYLYASRKWAIVLLLPRAQNKSNNRSRSKHSS